MWPTLASLPSFASFAYLALVVLGSLARPAWAQDDGPWVNERFVRPPQGALVVLLPMLRSSPYADANAKLDAQLGRQITALGYRVARISEASHQELLRLSAAHVARQAAAAATPAQPPAAAQVLATLARTICEEAGCALVVQPRLALRTAQLRERYAEWDGIRRLVSLMVSNNRSFSMTGTTQALSIQLLGLTAEGTPAFDAHGGITLVFDDSAQASKAQTLGGLLTDDETLEAAVAAALKVLPPAVRR